MINKGEALILYLRILLTSSGKGVPGIHPSYKTSKTITSLQLLSWEKEIAEKGFH